MRYRRALLLTELDGDGHLSLSALRTVAPELEHLVLVVRLPIPAFSTFSNASTPAPEQPSLASLERLRDAAAHAAPSTRVELAPELNVEALVELVTASQIDLLVSGSRSRRVTTVLVALQKRQALPLLTTDVDVLPRPMREVCCIAWGQRGRESIAAFLHDHVDPTTHVILLSPGTPEPDELAAILRIAGIEAAVEAPTLDTAALRSWLEAWAQGRAFDLFVFARVPTSLLLGAPRLPAPMLLLPPRPSARPFWQRPIDIADLVADGGPLRARVDYVAAVGDLAPVPDQELAFVSGGRVVATTTTRAGVAELPESLEGSSFGVFRAPAELPRDVLSALELRVSVLRPDERALVLFDAELSDEALSAVRAFSTRSEAQLLAVRLRPTRSCRAIRERLRRFDLSTLVVDARAVLDEGEALDVSEALDAVRLARVASRLRRARFRVTAMAYRGPIRPLCSGFVAWKARELANVAIDPTALAALAPPKLDAGRLTDFPPIAGNRVELELDNARARTWLLDAIAASTESVSLQVYMAQDDHVGAAVELALARAAARGVRVRVLVDSLHGLHGSFGISNPLLDRLGRHAGIEVRISRPITEAPSLAELKQRDHRKLVVVDGSIALVGGRNLSHEYYAAFDETRITPDSLWREVPWLDAGARIEGPAVAQIAASFLEAWTDAGGSAFPIVTPAPAGATAARVIVHRGLRDASTLEAYLELIDDARSHVYVVNGFPLMLELQHALLRALRRGVRVRALVGHVTPTHGDQPFKGPWGPARIAATELVHSRMDALNEAGGEVYHFALRDVPGWDPGLGVVHPHVHAKVVSVDGLRASVGSANLDITSAYWESELMLLIEDAALTAALELELDALLRGSERVEPEDPSFQQLARRRAWMRHWPGVLSI